MDSRFMFLDDEEFIIGDENSLEESYNVSEEDMNKFGIIECVEDPGVACYRIALENEQNYNAIMTAMLTREYQVLESTGKEMVYEASAIKGFLDRVHEMVQRFWAKVKGVFKKVMDNINSIVLSNKAFVKKYRSMTSKLKTPAEKNFTGYEFNNEKMIVPYSKAVTEIKKIKYGFTSEKSVSMTLDKVRTILCGGTEASSEGFAETLKEVIYGGKNTKVVSLVDFETLLNRLEDAGNSKKAAKDSHKEAESAVKGLLSEVKSLMSDAKSKEDDDRVKYLKTKADAISKSLTIMSTALSVQTRAIVAQAVQDRKMANYWVNSQNTKEEKK